MSAFSSSASEFASSATTALWRNCCAILGGRVARYLVVFHSLRRTNQREVGESVFLFFTFRHDFLAFLDEAHHPLAGFGTGVFT